MPSTATKKAKKKFEIKLPLPMVKPIFTDEYYCTTNLPNGMMCSKSPAAATCKFNTCLIPVKKSGHPVDEATWCYKAICKECFEKVQAKKKEKK